MKKSYLHKGFTLIELLVVIAIIGVLSSVVLASLNNARAKGQDSAVKTNLANSRAQAEIFFDANNNVYDASTAATDVCNASALAGSQKGINSQVLAAAQATGGTSIIVDSAGSNMSATATGQCNSGTSGWAALARLKSTNVVSGSSGTDYWCVDNSGASRAVDNPIVLATTVVCP